MLHPIPKRKYPCLYNTYLFANMVVGETVFRSRINRINMPLIWQYRTKNYNLSSEKNIGYKGNNY